MTFFIVVDVVRDRRESLNDKEQREKQRERIR